MRIHKHSVQFASAAAVLTAIVLLTMFGNADMAITVAVAAALVGMYSLRRHARARLVYGRGADAGWTRPRHRRSADTP